MVGCVVHAPMNGKMFGWFPNLVMISSSFRHSDNADSSRNDKETDLMATGTFRQIPRYTIPEAPSPSSVFISNSSKEISRYFSANSLTSIFSVTNTPMSSIFFPFFRPEMMNPGKMDRMTQMIDMPKMMMMTQNIKIKKIKMKTQQQLHSRQKAGINSNSKQQKPPIKPPTMALMFTGVLEGGDRKST